VRTQIADVCSVFSCQGAARHLLLTRGAGMHCSARPDDCIPNQSVYHHQPVRQSMCCVNVGGWVYGLSLTARDLSARSTTIKRVKKVSHTRIDPERSRSPSTWRRSMSWWVDGEESVFLTAERAKAGHRDAMWPENCNPEHSCAASASDDPQSDHP